MTERKRNWVVVHAAAGAEPEVWMTLLDVPAELRRADVESALAAWPGWRNFAGRVSIGGRLTVRLSKPADKAGSLVYWAEVIPPDGRFTIEVDAALRAAVRRSAYSLGQTVQAWCVDALAAAVAAQEAREGRS